MAPAGTCGVGAKLAPFIAGSCRHGLFMLEVWKYGSPTVMSIFKNYNALFVKCFCAKIMRDLLTQTGKKQTNKQTNSVAFSPQANYTD
jgi:hypothetical protein